MQLERLVVIWVETEAVLVTEVELETEMLTEGESVFEAEGGELRLVALVF